MSRCGKRERSQIQKLKQYRKEKRTEAQYYYRGKHEIFQTLKLWQRFHKQVLFGEGILFCNFLRLDFCFIFSVCPENAGKFVNTSRLYPQPASQHNTSRKLGLKKFKKSISKWSFFIYPASRLTAARGISPILTQSAFLRFSRFASKEGDVNCLSQ